ncbi:gp109 [Bacillus phage G]|uniref:Gp109 n=1 Tax=Bacillus phage G TaxID=2884420 RepID=G3MBH1_9CAUD|nr:gp109 [Bacillus phage G]AEO93371.1 gp109 [Bacillus phage G]
MDWGETKLKSIKEEILYVFPFGSKVYGNVTKNSDTDLIVVVKGNEELKYQICDDDGDIHVYSRKTFEGLIDRHDISALECIFSNDTDFDFVLDFEKLRRSISAVASNSFVKCKKKLTSGSDYNPYIAKKSMFHSIRILEFGIQIAKYGKITDFGCANHYYEMLLEMDDWGTIKNYFQPIANKLKSEFKKLAPLDKDIYNKKW